MSGRARSSWLAVVGLVPFSALFWMRAVPAHAITTDTGWTQENNGNYGNGRTATGARTAIQSA